jgi:D-serine deaminase-like pyridoxal phosphate-dependent protein
MRVLVEINCGANRCGVEPGAPAVALAQHVARVPGLTFAGLQSYHGRAQHLRTFEERRAAIAGAIEVTVRTIELLRKAGLSCEIVGGAGTGTFELEAASGVYNELQAGSYCFMDADYARNKRADGGRFDTFEHALFVYATVMSTPVAERAVVDAGLKALAFDAGMPEVSSHAGAVYERPSDEHGNLNVAACNVRPKLGDRVILVPGHCDPTVNLHDWYVGVRDMNGTAPRVESVWPVAARGALF